MRAANSICLGLALLAITMGQSQAVRYYWNQPAFGTFSFPSSWSPVIAGSGPGRNDTLVFGRDEATTLQQVSVLHVVDSTTRGAWVASGEYEMRFGNPDLTWQLGNLYLGGGNRDQIDGSNQTVANPPHDTASLTVGIPEFSSPGTIISTSIQIGRPSIAGDPTRKGELVLKGAGTVWHNTAPTYLLGYTYIGGYGNSGLLRVEDGAVFKSDGSIHVGGGAEQPKDFPELSYGKLVVDGIGSQVETSSFTIGLDYESDREAGGDVIVSGGGQVDAEFVYLGDPDRGLSGLAGVPSTLTIGLGQTGSTGPRSTFSAGHSVWLEHDSTKITVADDGQMTIGLATPVDGAVAVGTGGSFHGTGTVEGNLVVTGGVVTPGTYFRKANLAIDGDATFGPDSTLVFAFSSDGPSPLYGALDVAGTAVLAGQLELISDSAYIPNPNDTFRLITAGEIVGRFDGFFSSVELPPDMGWRVLYDDEANTVDLRAFAVTANSWINPVGGLFSDGGNWSHTSVADVEDVATFALDAAYQVTFTENVTNQRTEVRDGDVAVDLAGHTWAAGLSGHFTPHLQVGIDDGESASLTVTGGTLTLRDAMLGAEAGSSGTLRLSGAATQFVLEDGLTVGEWGDGALHIEGGAQTSLWRVIIANRSTGQGTVTVAGVGSLLAASGDIRIGSEGLGELFIEGGGKVVDQDAILGYDEEDAFGTVLVTGVGSQWINRGNLVIGQEGQGHLTIADGGLVENESVNLAPEVGAIAGATISGEHSRWTSIGSVWIGGDQFGPGGQATLDIQQGTVEVGTSLQLFAGGSLTQSGGHLSAANIVRSAGAELALSGGTITFRTFTGQLVNDGARLEVGRSVSVSSIAGDYTQGDTATVAFTLSGSDPGAFDQLVVTGSATLAGSLEITLAEGFQPVAGDIFQLIKAADILGDFTTILLPELDTLDWNLTQLTADGTIAAVPALAGDFDADGTVDAADYLVWRNAVGHMGFAHPADGNADGVVDGEDYVIWKDFYGTSLGGLAADVGVSAVPEPQGAILALIAVVCFLRGCSTPRSRLYVALLSEQPLEVLSP